MSGEELIASIRRHVTEKGYPPTIRELADEHGVAVGTIHARLVRLEEEGRIVRQGPRAIRILEKESNE